MSRKDSRSLSLLFVKETMFRSLIVCLVVTTACGGSDEDPLLYYSMPVGVESQFSAAVDMINDVVDCALIGEIDPGEYVLPIEIVEAHSAGSNVIGCAYLDEALKQKKEPRSILILEHFLDDQRSGVLFAHEIGHTLGLLHSETLSIMSPVINNVRSFTAEHRLQLQEICDKPPSLEDLRFKYIEDTL